MGDSMSIEDLRAKVADPEGKHALAKVIIEKVNDMDGFDSYSGPEKKIIVSLAFSLGEELVSFMTRIVEEGDIDAARNLTDIVDGIGPTGPDHGQLFKLFKKGSELGIKGMMYIVAHMYKDTKPGGPEYNYDDYIRYLRMAAEAGHVKAQLELGNLYRKGAGVPKSDEETFKWFHAAAKQHDPLGAALVAKMLHAGCGCERNDLVAVAFAHEAIEGGITQAKKILASITASDTTMENKL